VLVEQRKYEPYNPVDHSGYWKTILVRTNVKGEAMVCVGAHCQSLTEEEVDAWKAEIVEALTRPSLNGCVKSIFFNVEGHS
jgi:hypothetical protein